MTDIMPLSPSDRELLVRLPWRVGMWVSACDSAGGGEASEAESRALRNIIVGFVEDSCKGEVVQRLMEETVSRRSEWSSWEGDLDQVPQECRIGVDSLSNVLSPRDLSSFKSNLLEIGLAVASAWNEGGAAGGGGIGVALAGLKEALGGLWPFSPRRDILDLGDAGGISAAERDALNTLARSLELIEGA